MTTPDSATAEVQLLDRDALYEGYRTNCFEHAKNGLKAYLKKHGSAKGAALVGARGLKTYDTITKTGGAVDKAQTGINWNKAKSTTVQTYMKSTIDHGRPVLVGVNVRGEANKINEGLTDHFVLVYGYRVQLVAGAWAITAFFAVDNAAFEGRFTEFTVGSGGAIVKPAPVPQLRGGRNLTANEEYHLTQARIYQKDRARLRSDPAWR